MKKLSIALILLIELLSISQAYASDYTGKVENIIIRDSD